VASLSQGRTAAAQCGLFTHKSVPVIFEPPCISSITELSHVGFSWLTWTWKCPICWYERYKLFRVLTVLYQLQWVTIMKY